MNVHVDILRAYIRDELGYEGELEADADLLEEQVLDSFSIVELAVFVQERLGVELEPEDLSLENFACLSNIVRLIVSRSPA